MTHYKNKSISNIQEDHKLSQKSLTSDITPTPGGIVILNFGRSSDLAYITTPSRKNPVVLRCIS